MTAHRVAIRLILPVAVVLSLAACGTGGADRAVTGSTQAASQQPPTQPARKAIVPASALLHPTGKFFGLEADGAPDSLQPVLNVAASIGTNPNLLGQYVAWNRPFDRAAADQTIGYGALYYMVWEPFGTSVASIASGASDAYITSVAKSVRAFGEPMALSFGHEMNGNWYPWGTTQATPAEFVAAWRRIHDLFASAGADNVIWVWNPNIINPMPDVQLSPFWPGDNYVDWVGVTGYFATDGPHTFDEVYGPTFTEIRQFTDKPFIIAETAVETGPAEVSSVRSLLAGVAGQPDVLGLVWFDYNKGGVNWTIEDRPVVRAAVAGALAGMPLASLSG